MPSDSFPVSLQENILALLAFHREAGTIVQNSVEPALFGSQLYREVAVRVLAYWEQYRKPPGEHLADLFDEELGGPRAQEFGQLLSALFALSQHINEKYVLSQLEGFVRRQSLKGSIIAASEALQINDLEKAEEELLAGIRKKIAAFSPGSRLKEGLREALAGTVRRDVILTGIPEFDKAQLGPGRGEVHNFMGPPKRGKSAWLVHMTKQALLQRLRVNYITLELSEPQIHQRVIQSLFSLPRHKARIPVTRIRSNEVGHMISWEKESISGRLSLDDPSAREQIEKKLSRFHSADFLVVKQFPAGLLTPSALLSYLDSLERAERFIPDVLVIDYPDYMKLDPKNYRLEASALINRLRGIAVERNVAMLIAGRSNREGTKAKLVTETHAAEDYSRIFTVDTTFTYSQTAAEKALGLARIFASNTRVGNEDGFVVLISQAYALGQFCLESVRMDQRRYDDLLRRAGAEGEGEEEE